MFLRNREEEPEVDNEAYHQWLRAGRPDFMWFMRRSPMEREAMASIGDLHQQHIAIAIGYAVRDPRGCEAGVAAADGDVDAEQGLLIDVATAMARKIQSMRSSQQEPESRPRETMAGIGERKRKAQEAQQEAEAKARPRMFGAEGRAG